MYPKNVLSPTFDFSMEKFRRKFFYWIQDTRGQLKFHWRKLARQIDSEQLANTKHDKTISDLISRHERFVSVPRKRGIAKVIRVPGDRMVNNRWFVSRTWKMDKRRRGERERERSRGWISIRRDTKGSVCAALWKKRWFHCNTISAVTAAPFLTQSRW